MLSRFGCVRLFATPWTVAGQVPLSMGLSRQGCWRGSPFPFPPVEPQKQGKEVEQPVASVGSRRAGPTCGEKLPVSGRGVSASLGGIW